MVLIMHYYERIPFFFTLLFLPQMQIVSHISLLIAIAMLIMSIMLHAFLRQSSTYIFVNEKKTHTELEKLMIR